MNDDLLKHPFNSEYEKFVTVIRDLLTPIFDDVARFGLKARHLKKHIKRVEEFYNSEVMTVPVKQELISKYIKRFIRYRESLFTFLTLDGIPWNNNAAERAIRHLAVQRKISGSFTVKGVEEYPRMLGIAQTCRLQNRSFLDFLNSGEMNLAEFKSRR